jgi:hypothetical protein
MALEDRIRSSIETALGGLATRVNEDVRTVMQELISVAVADRDEALDAARREAREQAVAEMQRHVEEAEAGALTRLVESVRALDQAGSLTDVLDALAQTASREASRVAVFVVRNERLLGWRFAGFGETDAEPKAIQLGFDNSGVIGMAVSSGRTVTTREGHSGGDGPGFVSLPPDHLGVAIPVRVGGRVVAAVYADSVTIDGRTQLSSVWPQVIELLARHAARCLEALTVQKTASPQSPRFWAAGAARSNQAGEGSAVRSLAETQSPSNVVPGVMT